MTKTKKNIILKNVIILLASGIISNILEIISKASYTKNAGLYVISLYTIITPTLILIMTISQFSLPISISKISAEEKYDNHELLKNAYIIGLIINIITIFITLIFSEKVAILLNNKNLKYPIVFICLIIPFITISSIQRGFLNGKEKMLIPAVLTIFEEVIKLFLFICIFNLFKYKMDMVKVIIILSFNSVTEIPSIFIMTHYINKKYKKNKKYNLNINTIKDIINISLPTTLIRLISCISLFIEPIFLLYILSKNGLSKEYITREYTLIKSYIIPILLIPLIIFSSISTAILPSITKLYRDKKYQLFHYKILKYTISSIIIGILSIIPILIFPNEIINLFYNLKIDIKYIYLLAPNYIFVFVIPILSVSIQAMNYTNKLLYVTIVSVIIKNTVLYMCSIFKIGINSFIISTLFGTVTTFILLIFIIVKNLAKNC